MLRKKLYRKKRTLRPRRKYGARRTRIPSRIHLIKRLGEQITLTNSGVGGLPALNQDGVGSFVQGSVVGGSLPGTFQFPLTAQFKLSSAIDHLDLTDLFDRYKITGVKLKILFQNNTSSVTGQSALPVMYSAVDFDDNTPPTAYQQVLTKSYCKTRILNGNRTFSMFVRPRMLKELGSSSAGFAGNSSERSTWIDSTYPDVPHYGIKFWIDNWYSANDSNMILRIQPEYYLALKDVQ